MKKTKFLVALACFGLLITACNPGTNTSGSKPTSSSGNTSKSSSSSSTSTSSVIPDPEKYYEVPFGNEGKNSSDGKWGKGIEYTWTFSVPKHYTKVVFAVGAQMSSSSHGDRSLYTDHNGASSNDQFESNAANDGTCRITLKVNGVQKEATSDTYSAAGLTSTEMNYFRLAEFGVNAGDVTVVSDGHSQQTLHDLQRCRAAVDVLQQIGYAVDDTDVRAVSLNGLRQVFDTLLHRPVADVEDIKPLVGERWLMADG